MNKIDTLCARLSADSCELSRIFAMLKMTGAVTMADVDLARAERELALAYEAVRALNAKREASHNGKIAA